MARDRTAMPSAVSVSATQLMVLTQDSQPSAHRCQSGKGDRILQDPELREGHRMSLWLVPSCMLPLGGLPTLGVPPV